MRGKATRGNEILFWKFQALEPNGLRRVKLKPLDEQLRYTKNGAKLWIRIFPDKTVTARAAESRMGSGKGAVDYCCCSKAWNNFI
jgi:large subunit ribosomal protein L16